MFLWGNIQVYITFYIYWLQAISFFHDESVVINFAMHN